MTSRELSRWKYGWAKGWPEVWSYPTRPLPIPTPEGRAVITASSFHHRRVTVSREVASVAELAGARPEGAVREVNTWHERHTDRRAVCENLRKAAFYVRRHWEREGDKWGFRRRETLDDGREVVTGLQGSSPVVGLEVVDPLDIFNEVNECCREACVRPTSGGKHGNVAVFAKRCKRAKVCPVCGAEDGRMHAERVRVVAGRGGRPGLLAHLVLTHRDQDPSKRESCAAAWDRHERAWQRLRTGKHGKWWATRVYGFAMRLETTNGSTGMTWHPHSHTVLELQPGVTVEQFREELAERWARCTALAAIDMGLVDFAELLLRYRAIIPNKHHAREAALREVESRYGWDRASGWDARADRERWCELVPDTEEGVRSAAYQAAKYANPALATESPARLAEWLQWANGRKLTRWGGAWQGIEPVREGDVTEWKDGIDVRAWIDAQCEYDAREKHLEEVRKGNRPDVGELVRGSQETVSMSHIAGMRARGLERIHFEQLGCSRSADQVDDVRAWWAMLGEQRLALHAARKQLEGPDDAKATDLGELREMLRTIRGLPVREALPAWARIKAEIARSGPFGS